MFLIPGYVIMTVVADTTPRLYHRIYGIYLLFKLGNESVPVSLQDLKKNRSYRAEKCTSFIQRKHPLYTVGRWTVEIMSFDNEV